MGTGIEKEALKEVVREVVREELLNLATTLLPKVSDEEMAELKEALGPEALREGEFADASKWLERRS